MRNARHLQWASVLPIGGMALLLCGCAELQTQPRGPVAFTREEAPPFSFCVIGNTRAGTRAWPNDPASPSVYYLEQIGWINRCEPDFTVNLGDMIAGDRANPLRLTAQQWDAFDDTMRSYRQPLYMVAGSRDVWDAASAALYVERYGQLYYSWDHKGSHFTVLSAEVPGEEGLIGPAQREWLNRDLVLAAGAQHRFVFVNAPIWKGTRDGANAWMRDVQPLLQECRVDAVFAAQNNWYEPDDIGGITYIITGGGGADVGDKPELGDFHHFLSVNVPAHGPAEISVVIKDTTFPLRVVRPRIRSLVNALGWDQPIVAGTNMPQALCMTISNVMLEHVTLALAWEAGAAGTIQPTRGDITVAPGEVGQLRFAVPECRRQLRAHWTLSAGSNVLAQGATMAPQMRLGRYTGPGAPRVALLAGLHEQVVQGEADWQGADDCSATAYVVRRPDGLDITVDVRDDLLNMNEAQPWDNDSVELYFDTRPDDRRTSDAYERGVFQIVVVPDPTKEGPRKVYYSAGGDAPAVPGMQVASQVLVGNRYVVRVYLPFDGLEKTHYRPGNTLHFTFGVNDADTGPRETQIMWSGTEDNRRSTRGFGVLTLAP